MDEVKLDGAILLHCNLNNAQLSEATLQEAMIKGIDKGDAVVTAGGLHGKVTGVTDDVLTVEIAALKGEHPQAQGSPLGMLVPMAAIFLIFYFLLIRPQQKQRNSSRSGGASRRDTKGSLRI